MATQQQSVTYFNFSGGLNTEASVLNIEPNDATDLLNVKLNRDGSVERRPGIDFISQTTSDGYYTTESGDYSSYDEVPSVGVFSLTKPTGITTKYVCLHVGTKIKLYEFTNYLSLGSVDAPIFEEDISAYGSSDMVFYKTQFLKTRNRVYVINKDVQLLYIDYDEDGNLQIGSVDVFYRDIDDIKDAAADDYINDTADHDETWIKETSSAKDIGNKNYKCIKTHVPSDTTRPGLGEDWQDYWVVNGAADPNYSGWKKRKNDGYVIHGGKTYRCIDGHTAATTNEPGTGSDWETYWVLIDDSELIDIDAWILQTGTKYTRYGVGNSKSAYTSNIEILTFTGTAKGWRSGAMSAGRMWLTGVNDDYNKLYFSQSITEDVHATRMYQFADPYNVNDSDTVDTDGGTLIISDADEIISLKDFRGGILIFATNGVWFVGGSSGGTFSATDFSVNKVSDDGIVSEDAVVSVENSVIYFGTSGVYAVSLADTISAPQVQNISAKKIDNFYNRLSLYNKSTGKAVVNLSEKKLYFFTNFEDYSWSLDRNKYNKNTHCRDIIIYDFGTQAWSLYSLVEDATGSKVSIGDAFIINGSSLAFSSVVDNTDNPVETETEDLVEAFGPGSGATSKLKTTLLLMKISGDVLSFAFGRLEGDAYQDFSLNEDDTESYSSYIDTAQQIFGDIGHNKQVPYLTTLFKNITTEDVAGGCKYTAIWNWATSTKSFKYGTARQAYLPNKWNISYEDESYNGVEVVKNKHRLRGRGNSIQLRFENDGDEPFYLYGWQMAISLSAKV